MPYSPSHKQKTRSRIVECARILFNRHGFDNVTIEMVMADANLTRGGFYNHFKSKEALFAAAVSSFLMGRGAEWRAEAGIDPGRPTRKVARQMLAGYLSKDHLGDLDGQCPMIALPSDIARSAPEVRAAYQVLLESMGSAIRALARRQSCKETARRSDARCLVRWRHGHRADSAWL